MNIEERKNKLATCYHEKFQEEASDFFSSSGRMEILGNHTDHNHGMVLVGAIDLDLMAAAKKNSSSVITVVSENYGRVVVSLHHLAKIKDEEGTNTAIIKGVVTRMKKMGYAVGGFKAYIDSRVPAGSGVSSSAAFECLIVEILNYFYNDDKMDRYHMARIAQFAEKEYFGKPCGLMDQCGVAFGGVNRIHFKTINNPEIVHIEASFDPYQVVLVSTGGDHSNLTEHYAAILEEMKSIAHYFHKNYLSQVSEKRFRASIPELRKNGISDRAILRAFHFYHEMKTVRSGFRALKNGRIKRFIKAVQESGDSSYKYLQNTSIPGSTSQNINLALTLSSFTIKDGACRVHGGGFEGTILAFVHQKEVDHYCKVMSEVFGEENVHRISLRNQGAMHL